MSYDKAENAAEGKKIGPEAGCDEDRPFSWGKFYPSVTEDKRCAEEEEKGKKEGRQS